MTKLLKTEGHRGIGSYGNPCGFDEQRTQILVVAKRHPSGVRGLAGRIERRYESDKTAKMLEAAEAFDIDNFCNECHRRDEGDAGSRFDGFDNARQFG